MLKRMEIKHEVTVLTNGKLAFDYLITNCSSNSNNCPAFVILDHHMSVMDGMELMEALNKIDLLRNNNVVFLLLAINTTPQQIEIFKDLGVQEFTSKPLSKQTKQFAKPGV
nr:hypothetical protein [Adhaeribacter pallidiroseus]